MQSKISIITSLILGMSASALLAADPTFELWNKTDHDIYYTLEQDGKKIGNDLFHTLIPESKRSKQSNTKSYESLPLDLTKPLTLYINYKNIKTPSDWNEIIEFNPKATKDKPGKTIYVRLKKEKGNYIFGPQTGPWRGLKRKTERGYSLKNNVKKEDYQRYDAVKRDEAEGKAAPYLALPTVQKAILEGKIKKEDVLQSPEELSPYIILGVPKDATKSEIGEAAKRLSNQVQGIVPQSKLFLIRSIILRVREEAQNKAKK